jgi:hypothetical protein
MYFLYMAVNKYNHSLITYYYYYYYYYYYSPSTQRVCKKSLDLNQPSILLNNYTELLLVTVNNKVNKNSSTNRVNL